MAVDVTFELINGIKLGIEHINGQDWDEDTDVQWLIAIDLFVVRIGILNYSEEG